MALSRRKFLQYGDIEPKKVEESSIKEYNNNKQLLDENPEIALAATEDRGRDYKE
jgi:hypothetical protein